MNQNAKKRKRRPISRRFWSYLKYLPRSFRVEIIRSQFEVEYDLPEHIVLKQAETEDEIKQALKIVHDSYVELNYIDPTESQLRFSKFHALPTTVILVAKWQNEVIGTLSIIPDSALGLPSDTTWPLDRYRKNGNVIAEISSLAIKKDFRMRRGKLLLPLCKIMYQFCTQILQLDGIIIATTVEVEPFYTDILLFETVVDKTGQEHQMVKGNPSSCCYLPLNKNTVQGYRETYSHRKPNRNLYRFFVEEKTPNIQLPDMRKCVQAYTLKKNIAQASLLHQHESLSRDFSAYDMMVMKNLDITDKLPVQFNEAYENMFPNRKKVRMETRVVGWVFLKGNFEPLKCQILDVSEDGFQLNLKNNSFKMTKGDSLMLVLDFEGQHIQCKARVMWSKYDARIGCLITETNEDWQLLVDQISMELHPPDNLIHLTQVKKIA